MPQVNVLGHRGSPALAQQILNSPVLNATPSPTNPQTHPTQAVPQAWYRILAACYEAKRSEKDPQALAELEGIISTVDRRVTTLVERNVDELVGGAPGPNSVQAPTVPVPPTPEAPPPPQAAATPSSVPPMQMPPAPGAS